MANKRHPSLQPFSRDHHTGLVQAQQLMKAAQKTDSHGREIVAQFLEAWEKDIQSHFRYEETLLLPLMNQEESKRLWEEHHSIRGLVDIVKSFQPTSQESVKVLMDLAAQLQNHIRWEERELFPSLEQSLSQEQLQELQKKTEEMERIRVRK